MAQPYRPITHTSAAILLTCIKGLLKLSSLDSIYDMSIVAENLIACWGEVCNYFSKE